MLALALPLYVQAAGRSSEESRNAFLAAYCVTCHGGDSPTGGLALDSVDAGTPSERPEVWEKVARKLSAREMPPVGAPSPDPATAREFWTGLIADLDSAASREPYAGRTVIRRLNRAEYSNAVRDLLAVEVAVADQLPPDAEVSGFDNIGDALSMSPLLLESYLKVARRVSWLALGVSDPSPVVETFRARGTQASWQGAGLPYGTRGGIRVNYHFPYDGEYDLRAFLEKQSLTPTEGVRFFRTRIRLEAGPHSVVVAFPDEFAVREGPVSNVSGPGGRALGGPLDLLGTAIRPTLEFRIDGRRAKLFEIAGMTSGESAFDGLPGPPVLGRIEIAGPYNAGGVSSTPSRERILSCEPRNASEESNCAKQTLSRLARRAYRRDVNEADLRPLLAAYTESRRDLGRSFEASVAAGIRDMLLAPDFLFRLEFEPDGEEPGTARPISGFELASRLSFFLWSSIPDDELLAVASSAKLPDPTVFEAQVRRMLADRRSSTLASTFASQWLGLRKLQGFRPDPKAYPQFDSALGAAFAEETRLFLRSIMRENRSVLDLIGADYTYLNERLARNYGMSDIIGPGFRRVSLADNPQRGGLLGQGSVLMLTSHTTKTSPVLRGTWVLDRLLNSPPPPPPANVPALVEKSDDGHQLTARQQVERHRADPACSSCHARIDPLGFALENYDVIGRWRTEEAGEAIDPSAELPSGETLTGPAGLRALLLEEPERFARTAVERLMTYALGRELDARDQPTVRRVLRDTAADGYRFNDLILGVARSVPFQMRQAPAR